MTPEQEEEFVKWIGEEDAVAGRVLQKKEDTALKVLWAARSAALREVKTKFLSLKEQDT